MLSFKKIISILLVLLTFSTFFVANSFATNYEISTSPPSSTYVDYLSSIDLSPNEKYILFRSASESGSTHVLAVGEDLVFDRNTGTVSGEATVYIYNNPSYNSGSSSFYLLEDDNFSLKYENQIIYSNFIDGIPNLQSVKTFSFYKILLIIFAVFLLIFVIRLVFNLVRG